eukprot:164448-Rhodomonas_salina.2
MSRRPQPLHNRPCEISQFRRGGYATSDLSSTAPSLYTLTTIKLAVRSVIHDNFSENAREPQTSRTNPRRSFDFPHRHTARNVSTNKRKNA